jgi:hypothetical protein
MEPQNREQRRHPEKLEELERQAHGRPEDESPNAVPEEQMRGNDRVQDDLSVRAKNSGHGKKTADKWNQ